MVMSDKSNILINSCGTFLVRKFTLTSWLCQKTTCQTSLKTSCGAEYQQIFTVLLASLHK
jgi:hypothetical protein